MVMVVRGRYGSKPLTPRPLPLGEGAKAPHGMLLALLLAPRRARVE
jgi:hypothetical protein